MKQDLPPEGNKGNKGEDDMMMGNIPRNSGFKGYEIEYIRLGEKVITWVTAINYDHARSEAYKIIPRDATILKISLACDGTIGRRPYRR